MASGLYSKAKQDLADGNLIWRTGTSQTFKVVLVDTNDYTVNLSAHDFLDDIPAGARVATATIANPTNANGVCNGDDITFSAVSGDVSEALVIYRDSGNEATSPLIAYIDTVASGLPVTPNGGDITVTWDNGSSKIFAL
jgi:hypothetical protein